MSIHQTLTIEGKERLTNELTKHFHVAGERFHILPEHIKSVFPPAHSLGEHANVLPHIMLSRNTLPWEREAIPGDTTTPWLGLLVVHEDEEADATVSTVTVGELRTAATAPPWFPGVGELEPGQTDDVKVAVLDIKKSLLEQILPDKSALNFLTHVRQGKDDAGEVVGEDMAVVVANRLPQKGANNTVHLVSLEGRYSGANGTFDYQGADDDDLVRLVKLYNWPFTSTEYFKVSETFLEKASDLPEAIRTKLLTIKGREFFTEADLSAALTDEAGLTDRELTDHQEAIFHDFAYGDFARILRHLDRSVPTLRLPDVGTSDTDDYLKMGFYPLSHKLRQGARTVSWYHGPLSPMSNDSGAITFPAKGPDALLRYYQTHGMFDVSYAAAWELGRLLALQNTHFSTQLYQWKRRYAKCIHCAQQQVAHLQGGNRDNTPEPLPDPLRSWLRDLEHLKGVPFNYLVPDEGLLPVESIRFFQLDRLWVESLLDGAFSIGRATSGDHALDTAILSEEVALTAQGISGFVLRSEAVSGWPGMLVEGYNATPAAGSEEASLPDPDRIQLVRQDRPSRNVLLCLFQGDLRTLDLHLRPEVLHFGVSEKSDGSGYEKELRDNNGLEHAAHTTDVPLKDKQVLDVGSLLSNIQAEYDLNSNNIAWTDDPTSANLALQLLEGVERVRFIMKNLE